LENLWDQGQADSLANNLLSLRVYSSRLIGRDSTLVLHGGGNTSVKGDYTDIFGVSHDVLYVKGSGWDLATIEAGGFSPVKMETLLALAELESLSDADMVAAQRGAMMDPSAPTPSVEAILHALIPFRFVDHSHSDAVVTLSNTPNGEAQIRALYGDRVLVVPYVMPGFVLAKEVKKMTEGIDWSQLEGMVLLHHGIFSFADEARESYGRMIDLVSLAEDTLPTRVAVTAASSNPVRPLDIATLRKAVSREMDRPMLTAFDNSAVCKEFSDRCDVSDVATRGPLTPDHVIRTKRVPLIVGEDIAQSVEYFAHEYQAYFERYTDGTQSRLDRAPRWAVLPGKGLAVFGATMKDIKVVRDIVSHTVTAIQNAEHHGGWRALPEQDIFDVEYWELEQAKLGKSQQRGIFQGRSAVVTGGASGIGYACAVALADGGAVVTVIDKNPEVVDLFESEEIRGISCDVTDVEAVRASLCEVVRSTGGLDILVSNAGVFSTSNYVADMPEAEWQRSIDINLTGAMHILRESIPYLKLGWDPSIVIVGSKNVPAPGPAASAYSVAKAGLNQLARVLALELASEGIRVNTVHPNAVFDTAIWTPEVLESRAAHYGLSVEEYRKNNLLNREVCSADVARLVCAMVGDAFRCTTGAQVSIDGGNERVI